METYKHQYLCKLNQPFYKAPNNYPNKICGEEKTCWLAQPPPPLPPRKESCLCPTWRRPLSILDEIYGKYFHFRFRKHILRILKVHQKFVSPEHHRRKPQRPLVAEIGQSGSEGVLEIFHIIIMNSEMINVLKLGKA